jgi:hypothetical protein
MFEQINLFVIEQWGNYQEWLKMQNFALKADFSAFDW